MSRLGAVFRGFNDNKPVRLWMRQRIRKVKGHSPLMTNLYFVEMLNGSIYTFKYTFDPFQLNNKYTISRVSSIQNPTPINLVTFLNWYPSAMFQRRDFQYRLLKNVKGKDWRFTAEDLATLTEVDGKFNVKNLLTVKPALFTFVFTKEEIAKHIHDWDIKNYNKSPEQQSLNEWDIMVKKYFANIKEEVTHPYTFTQEVTTDFFDDLADDPGP